MKKTEKNDLEKKAISKKSDKSLKEKKKKRPVKETTTPCLPVSDSNAGYIPFE
jgi:hypothetical protein